MTKTIARLDWRNWPLAARLTLTTTNDQGQVKLAGDAVIALA